MWIVTRVLKGVKGIAEGIGNGYCSIDFYAIRKDASQNRNTDPGLVGRAFGSSCVERVDHEFAGAAVSRIVRILHGSNESGSRLV